MESFNRRQQTINIFTEFLEGLTNEVNGKKPKGILTRKWWVNYIIKNNKIFNDEEEEYKYVCKWGRGHWDILITKGKLTLKEKEQLILFAELYGAMYY